MKKVLVCIICLFMVIPFFNVKAEESNVLAPNAKSTILIEASTGEILYEFNSHEKQPPASMTNIMTT